MNPLISSSDYVNSVSLYKNIYPWILTEKQLRENGFPRPCGMEGRAMIYTACPARQLSQGNIRYCCRCKVEFTINIHGHSLFKEMCMYHEKPFQENKFPCCNGSKQAVGCKRANYHIYVNENPFNLKGYVRARIVDETSAGEKNYGIFALDCEMVYTTGGIELSKITIVNSNCKKIYESYVKTSRPIIDYNRNFSTITEEIAKNCVTTLSNVQSRLLHMFCDKTILVGYNMEYDLKALKFVHNTIIDISVLFPRTRLNEKQSLNALAKNYLNRSIQEPDKNYDSEVIAVTCMELLKFKLKYALDLYKLCP